MNEPGSLFLEGGYLDPLHDSGCAAPATGWTPLLLAPGLPCYQKAHSWGEFVFDQAIAQAYQRQGTRYYPRLVCCVPFTPVPGPRLRSAANAARLQEQVVECAASSAHVLFLPDTEAQMLAEQGWLRREQPRYVWRNEGYGGFEDFLGRLNSKRRKNIRRERREVAAAGLVIEWCAGNQLSADEWPQVAALYASTYEIRGQRQYLNRACLEAWAQNFGERMQFCLARRDGRIVAMAFYFCDGEALYGRHWGAEVQVPGLHFELCVYRGIERCISGKLARFDAGVQGEHKLLRGFAPERSLSMHWFAHPGFRAAVSDFFRREREAVGQELDELSEHAGYRRP